MQYPSIGFSGPNFTTGGLMMREKDMINLRKAIELAENARRKGNHPFGAVLADADGEIILEAENTVVGDRDITAHAETNLVRQASKIFESDYLAKCTIYASTEPCPMCAGAIFWGNIRRVVFALSESSLYEMIGDESDDVLILPCREVFTKGKKAIEVFGPALEQEARKVHIGFWN
jgi:tRNA(Arg) A34 adenosine deaminase TadA